MPIRIAYEKRRHLGEQDISYPVALCDLCGDRRPAGVGATVEEDLTQRRREPGERTSVSLRLCGKSKKAAPERSGRACIHRPRKKK